MQPIRVLLVDDHELLLQSLESLLTVDERINVVGRANNPTEAVQKCRKLRPDVVLMDYEFRNATRNGIDCIGEIRERSPKTRVIMLSQYEDDRIVVEALKAGAVGFSLKRGTREQLMDAIIAAHDGEAALPPALQRKLIGEVAQEMPVQDIEAQELASRLTPRERQVLKLVVQGLSNADIGKELGISPSTVKTNLQSMFDKLDCHDRTRLAVLAVTKGIVTLPARTAPRPRRSTDS